MSPLLEGAFGELGESFLLTPRQPLEEGDIANCSVLREGSLWQVQTILYPGADGWDVSPGTGADPGASQESVTLQDLFSAGFV